MSKDLILHVKREYFEQIKGGKKAEEFRLENNYWRKRLEGRGCRNVVICMGYPPKNCKERRLTFPWQGYRKTLLTHKRFGDKPVAVYAIKLKEEQ